MRFDGLDHRLHAFHDSGEVEFGLRRFDAELLRPRHMRQQAGRADQRLGRHAAGVQAISAKLVLLDQGDPGLDRGGDVGRHQPGAAAADDHQIALEAGRLLPAGEDLVPMDDFHDSAGDQRKDAEQRKRAEQTRRKDAGQRIELGQLGAGIDVNDGAGQHPELADPVEGARLHRRQAEQQVDQEERENRHQAQGEQIERAFAADAVVDGRQALAETPGHPVAEQEAGHQEGQRRADGRGERDDHRAPEQTEYRAAGQRQQRGTGNRQGGGQHIDNEIGSAAQERTIRMKGPDCRLLILECLKVQIVPEVESEKRGDRQTQRHDQCQLANLHENLPITID